MGSWRGQHKPNLVWGIRVSGIKLTWADTFLTTSTLCCTCTVSPCLSSECSKGDVNAPFTSVGFFNLMETGPQTRTECSETNLPSMEVNVKCRNHIALSIAEKTAAKKAGIEYWKG